jgi:hypothetical protein
VRISARTADGRAGQAEVKAGPGEVVKVELALKAGAAARLP